MSKEPNTTKAEETRNQPANALFPRLRVQV